MRDAEAEVCSTLVDGLSDWDSKELRRCLGQYATGITVMTGNVGGRLIGVTANSFASVSLTPPLILWSVDRASRSYDAFANSENFCVNVLSQEQSAVSQLFASKVDDKFASCRFVMAANGCPAFEDALAILECKVDRTYEAGDHLLMVGLVTRIRVREGKPLLFAQGRYGIFDDFPLVTGASRSAAIGSDVAYENTITALLLHAYHRTTQKFAAQRAAFGLDVARGRVLGYLYVHGEASITAVSKHMYLGARECEEAVRQLIDSGAVTKVSHDKYALTSSGRDLRETMGREFLEFDRAVSVALTSDEADILRSGLRKLIETTH
ncbi:flavin reductase [Candidimonas nitroreducens]|uniref:Flavin reductase like domain-containing protein n=1 Tax=Candidimonas nitroreducens TaxID=683354 RepID=A0A225MR26_9BURK|nr:flavin reductase [Candidimonas nitroreducens]OWT63645.1 hypothetical protein CEY11_04800 [Candidimonas nitroreducens]